MKESVVAGLPAVLAARKDLTRRRAIAASCPVSSLMDLTTAASIRGLATRCDVDGIDTEIPSSAARLIYRAAREAIRNVVTHAKAQYLTVTVTTHDGLATLVDRGGFGFHELQRAAALPGIREVLR